VEKEELGWGMGVGPVSYSWLSTGFSQAKLNSFKRGDQGFSKISTGFGSSYYEYLIK
jgi:hypothetical protein